MRQYLLAALACGAVAMTASAAQAGPEVDRLSQCVVENASPRDQAALVQWMFSALAANPALRELADPTPEMRERMNRALAATFERLVLVDCHKEMVAAAKVDGMDALKAAFEQMGKRAAEQLMSHPGAEKELEKFTAYLDEAKWAALVEEAGLDKAGAPKK